MINTLKKYFQGQNIPFLLLQVYMFVYFFQPAERYPFLQAFRLELLLTAITITAIFFYGIKIKFTKFDFIIFLFFLVMLISSIFSIWLSNSLQQIYQIFKLFMMYFFISTIISNEWQLKQFTYFFLFLLFVILWEPFFMGLQGQFAGMGEGGMRRAKGITDIASHPNTLGGIAATTLPFVFFLFRNHFKTHQKLFILFYLAMVLIVIKFSGSRGAMLTLVFFGMIFFFVTRHKVLVMFGVFFFTLILWFFVLDETSKERFRSIGQIDEALTEMSADERVGTSSTSTRIQIYIDGLQLFFSRPILGYGPDSFSEARGLRFGRYQNAHNLFIQCMVDLGIIGLWIFLYLLSYIIKTLFRIYKHSGKDSSTYWFYRYLSLAVLVYLVLRLFNGIFGHSLYIYYWWISAGFAKALQFVYEQRIKDDAEVSPELAEAESN